MSRFNRKKLGVERLCITFHNNDAFELIDNYFKLAFCIDNDEYIYLSRTLTKDELDMMIDISTFTKKRKALELVDKHLKTYYDNIETKHDDITIMDRCKLSLIQLTPYINV